MRLSDGPPSGAGGLHSPVPSLLLHPQVYPLIQFRRSPSDTCPLGKAKRGTRDQFTRRASRTRVFKPTLVHMQGGENRCRHLPQCDECEGTITQAAASRSSMTPYDVWYVRSKRWRVKGWVPPTPSWIFAAIRVGMEALFPSYLLGFLTGCLLCALGGLSAMCSRSTPSVRGL